MASLDDLTTDDSLAAMAAAYRKCVVRDTPMQEGGGVAVGASLGVYARVGTSSVYNSVSR